MKYPEGQPISITQLKRDLLARKDPRLDGPGGNPLISQATSQQLLEVYNLGPIQDKWEGARHPYTIGLTQFAEIAQLVRFRDRDSSKPLSELCNSFLKHYFDRMESSSGMINTASVGFGAVFEAFHLQEGPALIDQLNAVSQRDAESALKDSMHGKRYRDRITAVGRSDPPIYIPYEQVFLNDALKKLTTTAGCENCLVDGGTAAYNFLDTLRGKFYPLTSTSLSGNLTPAQDMLILDFPGDITPQTP